MDGLPVTIRLIDPPLHEFLPDFTELSVRGGARRGRAATDDKRDAPAARRGARGCTSRTRCSGLRGVRLGIVIPGLFAMQARAILEAAAARIEAGGDPRPEIMIPLVATVQELELVQADVDRGRRATSQAEHGVDARRTRSAR